MTKKTSPAGTGLITNDAFTDGINNRSNFTTLCASRKQQCGSKNPPHANEIDNCATYTHVYVGDEALVRAAEAYYWTPEGFPIAAMALPPNRSSYEFSWPVQDRYVIILSVGECDDVVYELGHALITSGAAEVIGTINNGTVRWVQRIEHRVAA